MDYLNGYISSDTDLSFNPDSDSLAYFTSTDSGDDSNNSIYTSDTSRGAPANRRHESVTQAEHDRQELTRLRGRRENMTPQVVPTYAETFMFYRLNRSKHTICRRHVSKDGIEDKKMSFPIRPN